MQQLNASLLGAAASAPLPNTPAPLTKPATPGGAGAVQDLSNIGYFITADTWKFFCLFALRFLLRPAPSLFQCMQEHPHGWESRGSFLIVIFACRDICLVQHHVPWLLLGLGSVAHCSLCSSRVRLLCQKQSLTQRCAVNKCVLPLACSATQLGLLLLKWLSMSAGDAFSAASYRSSLASNGARALQGRAPGLGHAWCSYFLFDSGTSCLEMGWALSGVSAMTTAHGVLIFSPPWDVFCDPGGSSLHSLGCLGTVAQGRGEL